MEAWRRAWLADPADPEVANAFAWAAATLGAHLDEALAAIEGAALRLPAWDPRGDHPASGYDAWLDQQRVLAGAIADTHGWVLYTLDRYEEAAGVLRHAVLLAGDEPEIRLHLGLCYEKLGNDAEALRELGRGLALTEDADGELERLARKRLEDLFPSRAWARGGLDAWIALQEPPARPAGTATDAPERIGQPFPDLEFQVGGEPKKLSDYAGIRVVDLWATWCGPCLRALPVVDRVAKDYAGRATVIAVSVDEERADAEGFYADQPAGAVVRAWAGPSALRRAGVQGIPSLFVIDSAGLVRAVRLGWGDDRDGRRRLAADLERALGE
jgi:thiol-disulfide isomerase/thioredoxin